MRRSALLFEADNRPTPAFARFLTNAGIPGGTLQVIDKELQKRFFQKGPDGQPLERWDLQQIEDFNPERKLKEDLTRCGFYNATIPSKKDYTRAGWPGALMSRAIVRLADLVQAWENGTRFQELIVFGGKRPLIPKKEHPSVVLQQDTGVSFHILPEDEGSEGWSRQGITTELRMMMWLWQRIQLPEETMGIKARFMDAPMKPPLKEGGAAIRPNTEDTILYWLENHKPNPGSMLLSSGAPYGMSQDEAFWALLEPHGHTIETFGHEAPDLPIEVFMREVAGCVHRIRLSRGM